jgi:hypothetical protein
MERLRNCQLRLGAARYEDYAGCQRRIVNQMRTGTLSRHTLLNVLERRSEHLWVCPVCKDENLPTIINHKSTVMTLVFKNHQQKMKEHYVLSYGYFVMDLVESKTV